MNSVPSTESTAPAPAPKAGLILVECERFSVTQVDGRIVLEIVGARPSEKLPEHRNYLTPEQLATRLSTSTRTLRKLMAHKTNPLPHVTFSGRPRFVEEEVYRWAQEGRSVGARRSAPKFGKPQAPMGGIFGRRKGMKRG